MRFSRLVTKEINKKVLKTYVSVNCSLVSANRFLVSINRTLVSLSQVKMTLRLTEKYTEFNQVKPRTAKTFTRNLDESLV